jgi:hypothetical protein
LETNQHGLPQTRTGSVWDLLAKAATFPDRVPILITAHVHYTLLTFFKAIGAVVYTSGRQSFAPAPQIPTEDFNHVTRSLRLRDARQLLYPDEPSAAIRRFFTATLRTVPQAESQPLIKRSQERWAQSAGVCERYPELRDPDLDPERRIGLFKMSSKN